MCTTVKETNIEAILAVMNTTELVVEIRPEKKKKKFRPARDLGLLIMTFIGLHVWLKRPP